MLRVFLPLLLVAALLAITPEVAADVCRTREEQAVVRDNNGSDGPGLPQPQAMFFTERFVSLDLYLFFVLHM